ncbi:DNA topoisomerase IV [Salinimicrobium sp. HB62]|uniref:DNA topoisomerase IV n=1 Tax=Salinimicrobium sp. HB62 TaxID=3077781 RepID=UPI002D795E70|nr:DNA topoisomerase IV [Salinimicrobium sp. HB62]
MKRIFFGLALFGSLSSCYQPERNCEDFRTGIFEFESYLEGELVKSRFIRNDSIEIDFFRGKTDTSSVRWINDCEYLISNLNPKNRAEEKPIHIKILTTQGNTYTFEYGLVGESQKQRGTVVKVE